MITDKDKQYLKESGIELISDMVINSKTLKDKLTFKEHVMLCDQVKKLTYEEVVTLLVTEDIRAFESKFSKFLKYSIAAIAGLSGGLFGPPVAMFVLYLYRKATDTCERSCFTKMPLSTQRKICRYECQLNAAKKLEREIRSQISKCSQMSKPDKCEKSLQKEYIKWAKRVQVLTIKLSKAKLDVEEKTRKQRQKELEKSAKSLRASLDPSLTKSKIMSFVTENETLRKKLTFEQHLKLYQVCSYIQEESDKFVKHIKIDPKKEQMMRRVAYVGLWVVPVPFFNDVVNYMVKKYSVACAVKCVKDKKISSGVCYSHCAYMGAKYASDVLNKNLSKCNKAKNPVKCKKKIYDLLQDWKQREVERKIKFEAALRKAARKGK